MAIQLHIVDVRNPRREHIRSFVQDRVVIGRARSCDVCLPDLTVSTRHVEVRLEGNEYKAVDLGSRNGTFVGGAKLVPHRPRRLANGDVLGVAEFDVRFRLGIAPGPPQDRDESVVQARAILTGLLSRTGEMRAPKLLIIGGPSAAGRYTVPAPPATLRIGRANDADIRLDEREVSNSHAEVAREGDKVFVRDLGSRHGVFVNGARVDSAELAPGLQFSVGGTTFALEYPLDDALAEIQNAPEEDTSTFFAARPDPADGGEKADSEPPEANGESDPVKEPLAVGPEDPLIVSVQADTLRSTREMTRPKIPEERAAGRGDLGLIAIGAILLVAAVVGLALLLS